MEFGISNNQLINLYSKENPILKINDICYCLITNNIDYHRPLICKGLIIEDYFSDGMNKIYFIQILEILESPKTINEFFVNKIFNVHSYINKELITKRPYVTKINTDFDFSKFLFKVECFFVRNSEEKILNLRKDYIEIIKQDLKKALLDIGNL
jgi:hypothetical protein